MTMDSIDYGQGININSERIKTTKINESLSNRLNYALSKLKISQAELARKIHAKPQSIQYLCKNDVKKSQFTYDIAQALEINYEWLSTGKGEIFNFMDEKNISGQPSTMQYTVPLINKTQLKDHITNKTSFEKIVSDREIAIPLHADNSCFAIHNFDSSMEPILGESSMLIVDHDAKCKNNDYVLAYIKDIDKFIVRFLDNSTSVLRLKPINKFIFNEIELKKYDIIIGKVIQTYTSFLGNN